MDEKFPILGVEYKLIGKDVFLISSQRPLKVLSSAIMGQEIKETRYILNYTVGMNYDNNDPLEDLKKVKKDLVLKDDIVGMMTAVFVEDTVIKVLGNNDLKVATFCTVGVGNAATAGISKDLVSAGYKPGTINSIILVDGNLTPAAMVNSVITATEAKVRALYEYGLRSDEEKIVTGTTTDAIVIACTGKGEKLNYAGTATYVGYLIGNTVYNAVKQGLGIYLEKKEKYV